MDKNCERCNKKNVCFIQPQIESLANKMADPPFFHRPNTTGDRTKKDVDWYNKWVMRQHRVHYGLRGIVAGHCQLYREK